MPPFEVVRSEASYWWRTNVVAGVILHRSMLLFIAVPLTLVYYKHYVLSFVVFALMIPFGFLLRGLAVRAVIVFIDKNPEAFGEFLDSGVITSARGGDE